MRKRTQRQKKNRLPSRKVTNFLLNFYDFHPKDCCSKYGMTPPSDSSIDLLFSFGNKDEETGKTCLLKSRRKANGSHPVLMKKRSVSKDK